MALVLPVSTDTVEKVDIWIESGSEETEVELRIEELDDIWDNYKKPETAAIYVSKQKLPANSSGWVSFPVDRLVGSRVLRLVMESGNPIELGCTRPLMPGFIRQKLERTRWHSRIDPQKELAVPVKILPAQDLFGPEQVVNGWSRPVQAPNLWVSDPGQLLPQWIELEWPKPVTIARLILLFDINLHREHRLRGGFYRAPECAKDYRIEVAAGGAWKTVWEGRGNYIRRNECTFEAATTDKLRVVVESTNGDPSARIYEVKAYAD